MTARDWTTAPYVIIGAEVFFNREEPEGWTSLADLDWYGYEDMETIARDRGVPILPARLVTEDEWAGQEKLRDNLSDQVVRTFQDGQSARAEVERLRTVVARVEALAEGYASADIDEDVYRTLADDIRAALAGEVDHDRA